MRMQWGASYPLSERIVRQHRRARWGFAAFGIFELVGLVIALTEDHPSMWTVTLTGVGTVFFPFMLLVTQHQLRKDGRIKRELALPN